MAAGAQPATATALTDLDRFAEGPPHELFDELRGGPPADTGTGPQGNSTSDEFKPASKELTE